MQVLHPVSNFVTLGEGILKIGARGTQQTAPIWGAEIYLQE